MMERKRIGPYAIRLVHLTVGWRYWAFKRRSGEEEMCKDDQG